MDKETKILLQEIKDRKKSYNEMNWDSFVEQNPFDTASLIMYLFNELTTTKMENKSSALVLGTSIHKQLESYIMGIKENANGTVSSPGN